MFLRTLLFTSVSWLVLHSTVDAQTYTTPHVTSGDAPVSVSLDGITFTNAGLVGTGRYPASTRDFLGDTLGSFSGLAIDPYSWRRSGSGYTATLYALPDRGLNDPAAVPPVYSDYAGRLFRFQTSFTPYSGANLPAATSSQSQLLLAPNGGIVLRDDQGRTFTGADPGTGTTLLYGRLAPSPGPGQVGAGHIALDSEAVAFKTDRSFYISDEYGVSIFYFDPNGNLKGSVPVPQALIPRTAGAVNFNSNTAPNTGRRNNQGLEALAVSPDGNRLITILQSATMQDNINAQQQTRQNTRILVYDISNNPTPTAPVESYVLQLPVFTQNGNGAAPNRTAAQSEMVALNDRQFLVLARDGIGQGVDPGTAIMTKSIYLVDVSQATNIAGTGFETSPSGQISPGGVLNPAITPARSVEVVNMLNPTQLARFGLTLNNGAAGQGPQSSLTLSEKWEGMALVPTLVEGRPNDFFLFVSNDNDFQTTNGVMQGEPYNTGRNNDNMVLVYQLTLPTAVDPLFLKSMRETAPLILGRVNAGALGLGQAATASVADQLQAIRRAESPAWASQGLSAWVGGRVDFGASPIHPEIGADRTLFGGTVGFDYAWNEFRAGVAATVQGGRLGDGARGQYDISASIAPSLYAGYFGDPFYIYGTVSAAPSVTFSDIRRFGAYDLVGIGRTHVDAYAFDVEAGFKLKVDSLRLTPFIGLTYATAKIDGFTEVGAAGGNVVYPNHTANATTLRFGAEVSTTFNGLTPSLRVAYNYLVDSDTKFANVSLAGVLSPMATQAVAIPAFDSSSVSIGLGLQGDIAPNIGWRVGYDANIATKGGDISHAVTAGLRIGF